MLDVRRVRLRLARDVRGVLGRAPDPRLAIARRALPAIQTALGTDMDPGAMAVLADDPGGPLVLSVPESGASPSVTTRPAAGSGRWILKVADAPVAIRRVEAEVRALRGLHAEPGLATWRRLVPRVLGTFTDDGSLLAVMEQLPGRPLDLRGLDDGAAERSLVASREAIGPLHAATGVSRPADAAVVEAWVLDPLARLEHALLMAGMATPGRPALAPVGATMLAALDAGPVCIGTIHGDYWPGNLLVDAHGTISGIVDWEGAQRVGSPVVDTIGVWLASRRRRERRSTGEMAAALSSEIPRRAGRGRGEAGRLGRGDDGAAAAIARAAGLDRRSAILLAWLAALDGTLARQPALGRDARWLRRNVLPVVVA